MRGVRRRAEVERLHGAGRGAEVVLGAAGRGEVRIRACNLRYLWRSNSSNFACNLRYLWQNSVLMLCAI
jgi:hypothetical protein